MRDIAGVLVASNGKAIPMYYSIGGISIVQTGLRTSLFRLVWSDPAVSDASIRLVLGKQTDACVFFIVCDDTDAGVNFCRFSSNRFQVMKCSSHLNRHEICSDLEQFKPRWREGREVHPPAIAASRLCCCRRLWRKCAFIGSGAKRSGDLEISVLR